MATAKIVKCMKKITEIMTGMYQKIEDAVVGSYTKIEDAMVGSYTKIEDKFVDRYLIRDGETPDEARKRLKNE